MQAPVNQRNRNAHFERNDWKESHSIRPKSLLLSTLRGDYLIFSDCRCYVCIVFKFIYSNQKTIKMIDPNLNVIAIIVAGLIPNILGALYYGPIFGKAWRDSLGKTEEDLKHSNEAIVYGIALVVGM